MLAAGQQRSAQHTSQSVSSFHEGSGIDLGAVARDLQAGQSGSDFGDNSTCQPNAGNDATISAKQQPDAVSEEASAGNPNLQSCFEILSKDLWQC